MLNLPSRLDALLSRDQALHSFVLASAAKVAPWARDNKTVFFPEYTDHSLIHLNEVIATADSLVSDDSWPHLTPEDAATTVTSVLLHDCALHLSEDGFFALIKGAYESPMSRHSGLDTPWPNLWNEFLAEAKRFDQRKLRSLFGDTDPMPNVPDDKLSLTLRHRLLIGEFLRRHHARLAHEIALNGIPGVDGARVTIGLASREYLDLCGFVARSHNLALRSAVEMLDRNKRRIHLNSHAPFVMSLLRIADFIQIHSARAPAQLLHLRSLVSPISRGEWRKHESVLEINQAHEDPEAIYIDAEPPDVKTFLALRGLFFDIQGELDQVWAVLGEVYGRFSPLNTLGINIRRIRSSLDNAVIFTREKKPVYVPRQFRFRTASGELMDLLVAPLYGSRPEIGVRELVQNAVDACLERDDLLAKGSCSLESLPPEDVVVSLDLTHGDTPRLIVEDYGVGMSLDVIDNYFLNIGASFRSSDLWRKNHETDGHSNVHRTGRFGIGVLAAFLLGDELTVSTCPIRGKDGQGMTFICRRGDETIEVRPCRFHCGTRIEVSLSKAAAAELRSEPSKWDWYCLNRPKVIRKIITDKEQELSQRYVVPGCDASLDSTKWQRLEAPGFDDVLWSYQNHGNYVRYGKLICNGIFVSENLYGVRPSISPELDLIRFDSPTLVVFDPDGRFPINLQRNAISGRSLPFERELARDISVYVAHAITETFRALPQEITDEHVKLSVDLPIKGYARSHQRGPDLASIMLTHDGVLPADLCLIEIAKPRSILLDATNMARTRGAWNCEAVMSTVNSYVAVHQVTETKYSRRDFIRGCIGLSDQFGKSDGFFARLPVCGRRILLRYSEVSEMVRPGNVPRSQWNRMQPELKDDVWSLWKTGQVPALEFDFATVAAQLNAAEAYGFAVLYLDWQPRANSASEASTSPFADAWLDLVHGPVFRG